MSITGTWDHRPINRRQLLGRAALGAGALLAARPLSAGALTRGPFSDPLFTLGVASGDPLPDGVVLWTRLAPVPLAPDGSGGLPARRVPVRWEVAHDDRFRRVARRGVTLTGPEVGHSVHVEVEGLDPAREYFYRFLVGPQESPTGRTRTAPRPGRGDRVRFAVASCQHYQDGYFTAYGHMAREDLDLVVHLGDYIYEGGPAPTKPRQHDGPEPETLAGYRNRHALYRTDADLRAAHAAAPWVVTFDDHEVDNDWAGLSPQDRIGVNATTASWLARRAVAFQAYYEHLPLRRAQVPRGSDMLLYRRVGYSDLLTLNVLDTRQYRDDQDGARRLDPARTLTGPQQERWVIDGLQRSRSRWNVLAQQVFFAQRDLTAGPAQGFSADSWDGYVPARERITRAVQDGRVENFVVLTGDVHKHYCADVHAVPGDVASPTLGSEFVTTSIATGGDGQDISAGGRAVLAENPHILFTNEQRGYLRCEVDRQTWRGDFRVVPYVQTPGAPITTRASYVVQAGRPGAAAA